MITSLPAPISLIFTVVEYSVAALTESSEAVVPFVLNMIVVVGKVVKIEVSRVVESVDVDGSGGQ